MRRNALWSAVEAGAAGTFSLLSAFLVARLVGPAALGVGAAATAVNVVLWVAVNALFADALVQRVTLTMQEAAAAFWAATAVGCLAALLQIAAGWGLATAMDDRRLVTMAALLAVPLPLVGAASVIQGLLTRERAYRALALRTILGHGLGCAVGIGMALTGGGAWAVVLQQAVGTSAGALVLLARRRWWPGLCWHATAVRQMLRVGVPLTASTLTQIGRYRLFAVLIGASAGPAVLGQVHIAFRLVDAARDLAFSALWRLVLPVMSPCQADHRLLLEQVDRWQRRCSAAMLPFCVLLAVVLTQGVSRFMGPAWQAAGHAALPLVGLTALSVLTFPAGVALVAAGGAPLVLYGNVVLLGLTAAGVLLRPPTDAWQAVMIWTVSQLLVLPYAMWINARALRVGLFRPLAGLWRRPVRIMAQVEPSQG